MTDFLFLLRGGRPLDLTITPEEHKKQMEPWVKWIALLDSEGKYQGGERLTNEGAVFSGEMMTDGPFAEGKEVIGGYFFIRANDMEDANRIAGSCPILQFGGTVEVRQVVKM